MRARTIHVKASKSGGRGPSKYLFGKKDSRGNVRDPKPTLLFGDPSLFESCVERSPSGHPYTSYVLSYKGEKNRPSPVIREKIRRSFLRLLVGGFAEDRIVALGVDHGEDEHGALLRHLVAPGWPRFQPYYHKIDKYCFSAFQWLTNRCYGLSAPEDPANHEWVSLAGKHFDARHIEFLSRLRFLIEGELRRPSGLASHKDFLALLHRKGHQATVVPHARAMDDPLDFEDDPDAKGKRVWVSVETADGLHVLLKGPLCNPKFRRTEYEDHLKDRREAYLRFLDNPYPMWESFLRGVRYRNERNRKRFPMFCEHFNSADFLGFEVLHPERHLNPVRVMPPATVR